MPATCRKVMLTVLPSLFFILLLLALPCSADMLIESGDASPAATAAAWNDIGNNFSNQFRWDRAIDAYTRAIALEPGYARAYFNRGRSYAAMGLNREALADYEKSVALDPTLAGLVAHYIDVAMTGQYPTIPSGSLVRGSWQPGNHFLAIDNTRGTTDLVVALVPHGLKGALMAVYVAKGYSHRFEQVVPQGYYDVYIMYGERYDSRSKSFVRGTGYLRWEIPQVFSGTENSGLTLTFIDWKPPSSWLEYKLTPVTADQFPGL
ncbi:MAG: tetratricopeptide repeat protein [Methanolinea sp.]|nr:tetratricopeptide repeat protein [Methanolinea sp.]